MTTSGFLPGDTLSRAVNLSNAGSVPLSSVTLTSTAAPVSALVTDPTNGLQLTLRDCSRAWTETDAANGAPTYTCGGTQTALYSGPAVGTAQLPGTAALNPGGTDHIVFTLAMPTTADNTYQGLSATLSLSFVGVQRTGAGR